MVILHMIIQKMEISIQQGLIPVIDPSVTGMTQLTNTGTVPVLRSTVSAKIVCMNGTANFMTQKGFSKF